MVTCSRAWDSTRWLVSARGVIHRERALCAELCMDTSSSSSLWISKFSFRNCFPSDLTAQLGHPKVMSNTEHCTVLLPNVFFVWGILCSARVCIRNCTSELRGAPRNIGHNSSHGHGHGRGTYKWTSKMDMDIDTYINMDNLNEHNTKN
jgi:hypothetical protein